jgi:hypothetical protein
MVGFCSTAVGSLVLDLMTKHKKIERWMGPRLIERSNNQLSFSVMGGRFPKGGAAGVECVSWRCPIVWVDDVKKMEKYSIVALDVRWPPVENVIHNNQSKTCGKGEQEGEQVRSGTGVERGGNAIPSFWG